MMKPRAICDYPGCPYLAAVRLVGDDGEEWRLEVCVAHLAFAQRMRRWPRWLRLLYLRVRR